MGPAAATLESNFSYEISKHQSHNTRCKYGADFYTSVHTLLNCINVYHELDESHCIILNVLGELLDCKSESSYIDCLNPDDIDCMVYLTEFN